MIAVRKLIEVRMIAFSGWGCNHCGWTHPAAKLTTPQMPEEIAQAVFDIHICRNHPRVQLSSSASVHM